MDVVAAILGSFVKKYWWVAMLLVLLSICDWWNGTSNAKEAIEVENKYYESFWFKYSLVGFLIFVIVVCIEIFMVGNIHSAETTAQSSPAAVPEAAEIHQGGAAKHGKQEIEHLEHKKHHLRHSHKAKSGH